MRLMLRVATGLATTVFAGGLVYGGVYRTQVKSAQELQRELGGNGARAEQLLQQNLREEGDQGGQHEGSRQGGGRDAERSGGGNGQGGAGQSALSSVEAEDTRGVGGGAGSERLSDAQQADIQPEELVTLHSLVVAVDDETATFITDAGDEIVMEGRALSFAAELGFSLAEGDEVVLTGFYEDADFEVSYLENLTTGQMATLREPEGRPLWAGGSGRRGDL